MNKTEQTVVAEALDALYSVLNVEGAAKAGAYTPAWRGLDVAYHFDKVREAIRLIELNVRLPL